MTTEYQALAGVGSTKYTRAIAGNTRTDMSGSDLGTLTVLGSNGSPTRKTLEVGTFGIDRSIPEGENNAYAFRVTGQIKPEESSAPQMAISEDGKGVSGVVWGPGGMNTIVYTGNILEDTVQLGPQLVFRGDVEKVGTKQSVSGGESSTPSTTKKKSASKSGLLPSLSGTTINMAMIASGGVLTVGLLYYANK